ncbi:hypothetical protein Cocul_00098 [Corynebacterium oculi]|uniref:ABC-2 family transporter protein n=1 Tax=Corynebacterium oculi TaxID=1544416 RepID=A0A0Q1AE91_9CORY|nr:hypothetical protein Cocul_00098 [Corynebacterium oculi]
MGVVCGFLMLPASSFHYYSHRDMSTAMILMGALCPVVCLAAAWEAGAITRLILAHDRAALFLRGAGRRIWWLSLVPLLAFVACLSVFQVFPEFRSGALWGLLLICLLHGFSWATLGAAMGLWMRPLLSIPLSIIIPYLVLVVPPTLPPGPLRHMFGVPVFCCALDSALSARMVVASSLGLAAVFLLGASFISLRFSGVRGLCESAVSDCSRGSALLDGCGAGTFPRCCFGSSTR